MPLAVFRGIAAAVFVTGIAGMIIGSIADNNNGAVVTFGLITVLAAVVLMSVAFTTRVLTEQQRAAAASGRPSTSEPGTPAGFDEDAAASVEERVQALVAAGASEAAVRELVGDAGPPRAIGERAAGRRVSEQAEGGAEPGRDPVEDDHALALRLAIEAGVRLVALRDDLFERGHPGWRVMDEGDLAGHRFLVAALAEARPADPVLSEEGVDRSDRLSSRRVWIVDPLDGTNEYGEGRPDWAVHVALVEDGTPVAGAVALPSMGRAFGTRPAPVLPDVSHRRTRFVVSRFRASYATMSLAAAMGADVLRMGSAGAKAMAVVMGEADVYAHAGGMYEWDSCAPAAVAAAAGLHVSRIDGKPLVYNRPDPWLPDLLVCRPELAEQVLENLWG